MLVQVYQHVHYSLTCHNYQFLPSIHYYTNTISHHLYHISKYRKAVTSRCGKKKSHYSWTVSSLLQRPSSLQRRTSVSWVSQLEPTRCSKNHTRSSECSLSQSTNNRFQGKFHYPQTEPTQRGPHSLQRVPSTSKSQ